MPSKGAVQAYRREYYKKHAEEIKAKVRAWNAANPERKRETGKAYRKDNKDILVSKKREYQKKNMARHIEIANRWRATNTEKAKATEQRYRDENRDACNARIRKWKKQNKDKVTFHAATRKATLLKAIPKWSDQKKVRQIYKTAHDRGLTVDHIVPLISDRVCGFHCEDNLQLLTINENSRKNNRYWPDMP